MASEFVTEVSDSEFEAKVLQSDKNNQMPGRYGIRGIPALLVFKNGKVVEQIVGFVPKTTIDQKLAGVLA